MRRGPFWLLTGLITLLALALRLPALGRSLWYDELFTYHTFIADRALWQSLWTYRAANNHPLYSACAWLSLSLPLGLEAALRLPALVMGSALIPTIAALGRRLFSASAGLIAAAMLAVAPAAVLYSQEARGYSGAALCVTLFFSAIACDSAPSRRRIALIIAAVIGAAGFHPAAALITLSAALPWLWRLKAGDKKPRLWLAWGAGHLVLLLLALPVLKRVLSFARRNVLTNDALAWDPGARLLGLLRAWSSWDGFPWSALILGPLALWGWRACRKGRPEQRALANAFLAASLVTTLFWMAPRTLFYPRFVLPLQPLVLLLAAVGLDAVLEKRERGRGLTIAAALLGLAALHLGPWRRWSGPESELQDLRGALKLARAWAGEEGRMAAGGIGGELMERYAEGPVVFVGDAAALSALRRDGPVVYIEPFSGSSIGPIDAVVAEAERSRELPGQRARVAVYLLPAKR